MGKTPQPVLFSFFFFFAVYIHDTEILTRIQSLTLSTVVLSQLCDSVPQPAGMFGFLHHGFKQWC